MTTSAPAARQEEFSARARSIQPTGIRKMFDMANEDTIQFGLGEPDFQPPEVAIEAFHRAMKDGHNKYTTTAGLPALREAIGASWAPWKPGLGADNVCITMSGTNALLAIALTLFDPGDNVLIPDPGFVLYDPDVRLCGAEPRRYACRFEDSFVPRVEDLESMVDERTKAILYCFPSNPTGGTVTPEQRDELVDFAARHGLWIITDEVYDRIVFEPPHVSFLETDYDRVVMLNSFSKTYAMTGWRIGYILSANLEAMRELSKIQYYVTACSNDAMQYAVLAAMQDANDYPDEMTAAYRERRDLMAGHLQEIPGVSCHIPHGAFYLFPRVSYRGMSSEDVAMALLADGVLCSPGSAFGPAGEGQLRFAFTTDMENMRAGIQIIEGTLGRLAEERGVEDEG